MGLPGPQRLHGLDVKKKVEYQDLADLAGTYGPVVPITSYEELVGLWLNLDRQLWRRAWSVKAGVEAASLNLQPPMDLYNAISTDPQEAWERAFADLSFRQDQAALSRPPGLISPPG